MRVTLSIGTVLVAGSLFALSDHSVAEFPRQSDEMDDTPRFQRAVDACYGGGLLTVPGGNYEFASTLYITNLCSVKMSPAAIIKAVKPMKWMVEIDCRWEHNSASAPKDVYAHNTNLGWTGGILDGQGIASCLALDNYAHFTMRDASFNNGRVYGLGVETKGRGYELMAYNLYFLTTVPDIEGNTAFWSYGGDSHYTDIVCVNYTVGIHLAGRGSDRLTRCHVWGTYVKPWKEGTVPDVLKESVAFRIDATDTVLRDCYADSSNIGFWLNGWEERLDGCTALAHARLLKEQIAIRQNRGSMWVDSFYPRRNSPKGKIWAGSENSNLSAMWQQQGIYHHFGGKPPEAPIRDEVEPWAAESWKRVAANENPDLIAVGCPFLLAAINRYETTCEDEASKTAKELFKRLKDFKVEGSPKPIYVYALWRYARSVLCAPGADREFCERRLVELAEKYGSTKLDFAAAYDLTGAAHWREKLSAGGPAALKLSTYTEPLIKKAGASSEEVWKLLAHWYERRHRIFLP